MSCGLPAPGPAEDFEVRELTRNDVEVWYHVFSAEKHPDTTALTFAEGWGNTRFAPILQTNGAPVHTYYAASSSEAAYMESLLHDVSLSPPGVLELDRLRHYQLAQVRLPANVAAVSFHTPYLERLQGLTRAFLIDSLPVCYPETRAWAQAAFLQRLGAQAIAYGSRRNDAGRCVMLFKQRLPDPPFEVLDVESLALPPRRAEVLALARSLKLHLI